MIRHLLLPVLALAPLAATDWAIDPVHSSALFRIQHLGVSFTHGRFDQLGGTLAFDPANPAASAVTISVQTASVSTANQQRDDHLRSADFLDARQFPAMTFASKAWTKAGDNLYEVSGDLTIHGVTKAVTAKATGLVGKNPMNQKDMVGFETVFDIKRSDFGMTKMVGPVGDDVRITIAIEAEKK